eukprot:8382310-Alexandrium_andersonii.AAC.1
MARRGCKICRGMPQARSTSAPRNGHVWSKHLAKSRPATYGCDWGEAVPESSRRSVSQSWPPFAPPWELCSLEARCAEKREYLATLQMR